VNVIPEEVGSPLNAQKARWLRFAAGVVLGALALLVLWQSVDMANVAAIMRRASAPALVVGLLAYALDFFLRAVRFWLLLDGRKSHAPMTRTIAPFIASFGISDILPFRLGDAYRVHWYHKQMHCPIGMVVAAMVVERLLDLLAIVALAGGVLFLIGAEMPSIVIDIVTSAAAISVLACLAILLSPVFMDAMVRRLDQLRWKYAPPFARALEAMAKAIRQVGNLPRMCGMIAFSLVIWLLEGAVAIAVWISLEGPAEDLLKPLFAFAVAMLGTLVPALPGHFGSFDYAGVLSFAAIGVDRTMAAAVILILHLMLWLPTALFAVSWLALSDKREAKSLSRAP